MHRSVRAAAIAIVLTAIAPAAVAAHAQLLSSTPAADETVAALPSTFSLTFDDELATTSSFVVLDASGATVLEGAVDPVTPTMMTALTPELPNGRYQVRWTAGTPDGHIERGAYTFTVTLATAPPATAQPTPAASLASTPPSVPPSSPPTAVPATDVPSPVPSATEGGGSASGGDVVIPIVAAAVLVAAGLVFFLRRRGAA